MRKEGEKIARSVLCVGETVVDYLANVKELPKRNQTVKLNNFCRSIGGGSLNVAIMLSQLGIHAALQSHGGRNVLPFLSTVLGYNVDLSLFKISVNETPSVFVFFEGKDQMTFYNEGDENDETLFQTMQIADQFDIFCLVGSRLSAYRQWYVELLHNVNLEKKYVVFCPAWSTNLYSREQLQSILSKTDLLIANQQEYQFLSDCLDLIPCDTIIKTIGNKGCEIMIKKSVHKIPALPNIPVVNPSGAGDAFIAGCIYGILNGYNYVQSAQLGICLSSFVIQVPQSYATINLDKLLGLWKRFCLMEDKKINKKKQLPSRADNREPRGKIG
jgi:sugar/nucleoside kinase (ribokinase family)